MKLLVIVSLVTIALAKPAVKPPVKRQFDFTVPQLSQDFNQFGARTFQNGFNLVESQSEKTPSLLVNQDLNQFNLGLNGISSSSNGVLSSQGFSSFNGPEITNVGSSGLNSNGFVSTTTASPVPVSFESFSLPTSTISPLLNSEISSINSVSSLNGLPVNSAISSGIFAQNLAPTVTPLSEISRSYADSSFNGFNVNPTALPIVSSTVLPSSLVQNRFGGDLLLNNLQGFDLNSYRFNNLGDYQQVEVKNNQKSETTKSVYFYEAPEEPEPIRQRKIIQLPPQKTNYKLLFIKAPSAPEPQPIEIPTQVLNQEKTRVYVLVKKPETEQQVRIVAGPTPKPEKPEVFYIKYKTREEAEKAIKEAQEGASLGQESISVNGQQLVNSIKNVAVTETGGNTIVKQTFSQNLPSSSLRLFESSTALPIISSTFSPELNYVSNPSSVLLNDGGFNQFASSYTPSLLGSKVFATSGNNLYSVKNNIFSNGNLGFGSGNLGSFQSTTFSPFQSSTFSPNTYVSSGLSNFPSFVDLSQRSGFGFRSGRVDKSEENKSSSATASVASTSSFGTSFEAQSENKSTEESTSQKDEPLLLSLGSGSSTSSPIFTNALETSTEAVDAESSTSSV
ncbi:uncharacterized protein LOC123688905 [Harmonia axyridis]|uniref:uncharacterized protein LOC123688905 n=1 Tax=Harmonia axyridis TaxID=115357 RepID=UPI001E275FC4|nr:uncharacterized protein LOC123688905 [Harmonia axyridis]